MSFSIHKVAISLACAFLAQGALLASLAQSSCEEALSNAPLLAGLPEEKTEKENDDAKTTKEGQKSKEESANSPDAVQRDLSASWVSSTKSYNLAADSASSAVYKETEPSTIEIESGTILIEALKSTRVVTPLAQFELKPKALILVRVDKESERALALLEGVTVHVRKRSTDLRFGEQALITTHAPSHAELIGSEQIGIRQVRQHAIGDGHHISITEYSLVQATERIPLISKVIHSGHAHDKALKSRLIKAAAVLNMVTSRHGGYNASH